MARYDCEWCALVKRYTEVHEKDHTKEDRLPYIVTREPETGCMIAILRKHGACRDELLRERMRRMVSSFRSTKCHLQEAVKGSPHHWVRVKKNVINGGE